MRQHWALDTDLVFLNHGSFGACPKPILALQNSLRRQMETSPVQFLWRQLESRLHPVRAELATFVGAKPRDLVFVTNATCAVNAVVRSWPLRRGDDVLTTNLDYNACRNVLTESTRRAGAKVIVAPIPFPLGKPDHAVEAILRAVTPRTRYAMIDHVTSASAMVLPIARIVRELAARGVETLVDGAHAPGMLSLNLTSLRPAWYCGNLHKWVCAPKGSAFLWAREDCQEILQPAVISHGNNSPRPGFSSFQDRFDWAGTFDPSAWLCVAKTIEWLGGLLPGGWPELRRHNHALACQARRLLCTALAVETPCPAGMLGSMATIPLPEHWQYPRCSTTPAAEQTRLYADFRIEVPFVTLGTRRYLRVSAHLHNHLDEYAFLAAAINLIGK